MAINDPIRELFPGINAPDGTGAPGSEPPGGDRSTDSVAVTITPPTGETWNRYTTETHSTTEPGQVSDGLTGTTEAQITDSGAGHGSAGHFKRFPWQAKDGA